MIISKAEHTGNYRIALTYVKSNIEYATDAMTEDSGLGKYPTPVGMLAEALSACALVTACMGAKKHGLKTEGYHAEVEEIMVDDPTDTVTSITIRFHFGKDVPTDMRKRLEAYTLHGCTVGNSITAEKHFIYEYDL